jgi:addiction module RelB/DinJ family antitoxin
MPTALVQAKVDAAIKKKAEKVIRHYGLDTSTAVRMFLTKIANTNEIPIKLTEEDELGSLTDDERYNMDVLGIRTVAGYRRFEDRMKEADKEIATGNLVGYDSVEEAFTEMLGEDYVRS